MSLSVITRVSIQSSAHPIPTVSPRKSSWIQAAGRQNKPDAFVSDGRRETRIGTEGYDPGK
ncbi:hypothetical protein CANCADRAFT_4007 [Tortispora caseinolytica NRRL Y-17796]|uniref:Uncharacterized protein n=1 Tax=Tortispora caseinolytica NRRL Y-17796 TaxID=767744 RepID=A0A1E4TC98_9ASCO|nr:hypothetical protein CANCADRAFT_4007 [Tortispora caseinolytica NRRL Y-17796]